MSVHNKKVFASGFQVQKRGVAAVEFALLSPFLALIFLGMAEVSRGMMMKVMLSSSAHMACRTGIQRDKGNGDIVTDATNIIRDYGLGIDKFNPPTIGSITVTVTDPNGKLLSDSLDAPSCSIITVMVAIPVSSTTWTPRVFIRTGSLESETVVMMKQ